MGSKKKTTKEERKYLRKLFFYYKVIPAIWILLAIRAVYGVYIAKTEPLNSWLAVFGILLIVRIVRKLFNLGKLMVRDEAARDSHNRLTKKIKDDDIFL